MAELRILELTGKELSYLRFSFKGYKIVVSEDSMADFKYCLKELSNRNWSVSMDYRMTQIRQCIRGWMGYFGLSAIYNVWLPINRWLRQRLRICYWRMWKRAKRRYLNLRKLGAKHRGGGGLRPHLQGLLAHDRLNTDCVASRSVWLRFRTLSSPAEGE